MIRLGKESKLAPVEVIEKAVEFFGPSGQGLTVLTQDHCCARFEGGGGFVSVQSADLTETNGTQVTIEGREWDYQIKQFMKQI
jgi:hypothetical protein